MAQKIYQVKNRPRQTKPYICEDCQGSFQAASVARWCPNCRIKRYRDKAQSRVDNEEAKARKMTAARHALRESPPGIGLVSACGDDVRHDHADPAQQRQQALAAAMDPWAGSACRREPVAPASPRSIAADSYRQPSKAIEPKPTQEPNPMKTPKTLICCDCQQPTPRTGQCQKRCPSCKKKATKQNPKRQQGVKPATPVALPGTPERLLGSVAPEPTPVPEPTGAGAPVSQVKAPAAVGPAVALLAPMRTILEALSAHHGLIAQRALAADNALASLQAAMG